MWRPVDIAEFALCRKKECARAEIRCKITAVPYFKLKTLGAIILERTDRWIENNKAYRVKVLEALECDENGIAFPHWILGAFSEITGDIFVAEGRDYAWFASRGQVWFLVRMSMRVRRLPHALEKVVLSYWYRDTDGKSMFNDYELRTPEGELLVSATSVHRPYDINACRTFPVNKIAGGTAAKNSDRADAPACRRIMPPEKLTPLGERTIVYTDIDHNHHVNNAIYSRIAEDFLPDTYRGRELFEYYINFIAATQRGEVLVIAGAETPHGYILTGECDGQKRFSSEFVFR